MSELEQNKAIVHAYVEAMNGGDFDRLASLFTKDAEIQGVTGKGTLDFALNVWRALHEGLNMELLVQEMIAEGDIVSVRYVERGRWTGPFLGLDQPTGRTYELVAMEWFELADGQIARRWGARDAASQARQLGFQKEPDVTACVRRGINAAVAA